MAKDPSVGPVTLYNADGSQAIVNIGEEKKEGIGIIDDPITPLDWVDTPSNQPEPVPVPDREPVPFVPVPVIILAGGKGTRLAEETHGVIPKPLIEVGGTPLVEHIINIYAQQGMNEFYIATGFKAESFHRWWIDRKQHYEDRELKVLPVTTGIDTGTGGRLLRLRQQINDRNFMMTYGDGFANIDLLALHDHFYAMDQPVALTAAHPPTRFGNLEIEGGMAIQFGEKTQTSIDWINAGFYFMKPEIFKLMPQPKIQADACRLEFDILPMLAAQLQLAAYQHFGFFQMVDTPRDLRKVQLMWEEGDVPWLDWMTL